MGRLVDIIVAFANWLFRFAKEVPSPHDIIKESQVTWDEEKGAVIISGIEGDVWVTGIADTNSMDGLMDYSSTVILIKNFDKAALVAGDIIVFHVADFPTPIIHRIVDVDEDEQGRRYRTQGDNVGSKDPWKLRDGNIDWLCVGIIY